MAQQMMDHLLDNVFGVKAGSPVHKALDKNGYVAPEDFLMEKDEILDDLTYADDKGNQQKITKAGAGMLKTFKQFVAHHNSQGQPYEDSNWTTITRAEFNKFRSTFAGNTAPTAAPPVQQMSIFLSTVVD